METVDRVAWTGCCRAARSMEGIEMALVIGRKPGEQVIIGDFIVTIVSVRGNRVQMDIDGPRDVKVLRGELSPHFPPRKEAKS